MLIPNRSEVEEEKERLETQGFVILDISSPDSSLQEPVTRSAFATP
jgi:hypothetical protein